jgi:hypothetical protein
MPNDFHISMKRLKHHNNLKSLQAIPILPDNQQEQPDKCCIKITTSTIQVHQGNADLMAQSPSKASVLTRPEAWRQFFSAGMKRLTTLHLTSNSCT